MSIIGCIMTEELHQFFVKSGVFLGILKTINRGDRNEIFFSANSDYFHD